MSANKISRPGLGRLHGNPARGERLWKGRAELSKERWTFWKRRFGEVKEMEELTDEVSSVAGEVVGKMAEVDKET